MFKLRLFVFTTILIISACSSVPNQTSEITQGSAVVAVEDIGFYLNSDELFTEITGVYTPEGKEAVKYSFWTGLPQPLKLSSGEYILTVRCSNSNGMSSGIYNNNKLPITVEENREYIVYCLYSLGDEKTLMGSRKIDKMIPFFSLKENYAAERKQRFEQLQL